MSQTAWNLASLLTEHPIARDEVLLYSASPTDPAGVPTSAAALIESANAVARQLRALGLGAGAGVAVQRTSAADAIAAMFGAWLAGAVFIPVNPRSPRDEVAKLLEATRPAALLLADHIEELGDSRAFDADAAFVMFTSGTTGVPKPIVHTHDAYFKLLDGVLSQLRGGRAASGRRGVNLIPVALSSNAGIYNVLFGLRAGATLVVMDRFDTAMFAELVALHHVRSTVLPPAAISMLADDVSISTLAPLEFVRSITAPLSPLHARRFTERFGVFVLNGYGQAEIGEVIGWTAADARGFPQKVGAAGRPHPGIEIRIDGADVDEIGPLLVRQPAISDEFVDTGDLARIDIDGFVWIEGRAGDVINRGGNKVFPEHVDEVLRLVPGVIDAAVFGVPDDRLGEVPVACIVVEDETVTDEELEATCRRHLVAYKVPTRFLRVEALPRNEAGKIMRVQLADLYRERQGLDP